MKLFIKKSIIFLIIFLIFLIPANIFAYLVISDLNLSKKILRNSEVQEVIVYSKQKINFNKVILGDSVAKQVFNNKQYYILTSNRGVSLVGQYILIKNILEKNPIRIKEINLCLLTASLADNLDESFTFNSFVKPFNTIYNRKYFSDNVFKQLYKCKFYDVSLFPIVKIINFPQVDYSILNKKQDQIFYDKPYISVISLEYLKKINLECNKNNIHFNLIPSPMSDYYRQDFSYLKKQIDKDNDLKNIFSNYFDKILYFHDTNFIDHMHFKEDFLNKNKKNIQDKLL